MFDNKDRQLIFRYKKKYEKLRQEYGEEQARQIIEGDIVKIIDERRYNESEK